MKLRAHLPPRWVATVGIVLMVLAGTSSFGLANLSGSNFESNDGNLIVNTLGNHDWDNAPNRVVKLDLPSGGTDDAFGQGAKEDIPNPSVVNGSIPPNKSDLTRFYVSHEQVSGSFFVYLAWERTNVLGSANMDFELNQSATLGGNGVTPVRTAGDVLITFDFVNGGGTPVLGMLRWVTSGSTSQCFANNSLPCWGNRVNLSAAGFADGAVNSGTVTDPVPPDAPRSLPANTFGEAAVNLTAAGVIPAGACVSFANVYLKSRSSASFTAELKDFIAPTNPQIKNCGRIIIRKVTSPSPDPTDTTFSYTTTGGLSPSTFDLKNGGVRDYGATVLAGTYSVTETDPAPNFVLSGLDCSASDVSHGSTAGTDTSTRTVSIVLQPEDTIDCTYTNTLQQGAIKITKTAKNAALGAGDHPQSGVSFTISGPSGTFTVSTGTDGTVCKGQLLFGSYTVTESVPSGYQADSTNPQTVAVGTTATCGSGNEATATFHNTPLSQIRVTFHSKAGVGVTTATIQCTGDGSASSLPDDSTGRLLDNLAPGTYSCTVVVDP